MARKPDMPLEPSTLSTSAGQVMVDPDPSVQALAHSLEEAPAMRSRYWVVRLVEEDPAVRVATLIGVFAGMLKVGLSVLMSAWSQNLIWRLKILARVHPSRSTFEPAESGTEWKIPMAPSWKGMWKKGVTALTVV